MTLFDLDTFVEELYTDLTHDSDILNGIAHAARNDATPQVLVPIASMILNYAEVGDETATAMMYRGLGTFIGTGVYLCQELVGVFLTNDHLTQLVQFLDVQDLFFGDETSRVHAHYPLDPANLLLKITESSMPIIEHMSNHSDEAEHTHEGGDVATMILSIVARALIWRHNAGVSTTTPPNADTPLRVPDDLI